MKKLDGQVVIVTGASSGIGEAAAREIAREGACVVVMARRRERLDALVAEITAAGGQAVAVAGDITVAADRDRVVAEAMERGGRIDALINNAGYGQVGPVELIPLEAIRQNFETNLFSLIALTQQVIPVMRRQRRGRIINISSVAGRIARPFSSVYDATKHALEAISDGLRGELAPFGIHVVVIEPGYIRTEFTQVAQEKMQSVIGDIGPYAPFFSQAVGRYGAARQFAGRPEDIARLIVTALTTRRPRTRYAAPGHAHLALAVKRLLPDGMFHALILRLMGLAKAASAPPEA
ncbi:MAG TPA: SDR family NAD(P)-dependent oxidoreductase [Blastocatellia bacterium]|nr:SDR family NAD(P)-dependent oxidoreductase [Blastocatellia bacterium]